VGAAFPAVATATALPAAAANAGKAYWVTDTAVIVVSDGTRWRTAYSDTGLRNVAAMLTDPSILQTAPAPIAQLRRYGATVEMYCDFKVTGAPTSPFTIITLPVGFRHSVPGTFYGPMTCYGATNRQNLMSTTGVLSAYSIPGGAQDRYKGQWMTQDAWPATLPGIAVGVPN
jgi:hypothetical protein